MATDGFGPVTHGGIFVRLFNPGEEQIRKYFEGLPYKQNTSHWYKELLQGIASDNECSDWSECPIPGPHLETLIQNGVYALAYAVDSIIRNYCHHGNLCNEVLDGKILLHHLLNVTFPESDGSMFSFDENGDTAGQYVIRNMQLVDGEYQLVDIGIWDPHHTESRLNLREHSIQWQLENQPPRSECVEYCGLGYISIPLEQKCCFGCQRCPSHAFVANGTECIECPQTEWPDKEYASCQKLRPSFLPLNHPAVLLILVFSFLGLILCLLAISGLWYYHDHQLVKASSRELSTVNLAGLILAFTVSSCCLTMHPSVITCVSIETIISLSFTLSFTPMLLKVSRIWRIFNEAKKSVQSPRFVGTKSQLVFTIIAMSIQVGMKYIIYRINDRNRNVIILYRVIR
ncbi:metabotropic glutamate receptor 5-like [Amphiura filiformis]|uniref:metabotropic glutamate receptor 5-like n=1 Tax=Amphiura filiformis TaxID=82378 RepID=UPI003B2146B7